MLLREILLQPEDNIDDIVDILKNDCKPFIEELSGKKLMHGKKFPYGLYRQIKSKQTVLLDTRTIRDNRKPMTTDPILHDVMDQVFKNRFGVRFRSHAIFAFGSPISENGMHSMYGHTTTLVFPISDFSFCWASDISDMTVEYEMYPRKFFGSNIGTAIKVIPRKDLIQKIDDNFEKLGYTNTDLYEALKSGNEIMISGDRYYSFLVNTKNDGVVNDLYKRVFE